MKESTLLEIDGFGNILLGLSLVLAPEAVSRLLGITPHQSFYAVVVGGLLIGIGIALLVERFIPGRRGLGLDGAITINLTFGIILASWLIRHGSELLTRGMGLLWFLVVILVGLSAVELITRRPRAPG